MSSPREQAWVVDSIEDGIAALERASGERRTLLHLPAEWLPRGAREGDWLRVSVSGAGKGPRTIVLAPDAEATRAARAEVEAQVERLRAGDPGGDLTL
jgi:hypothetical protein